MGLTTHCTVEPPCRHFLNSSTINISGFGPENVLTIDEIVEGARLIGETGISGSIHGYRLRCERTRYIRIPSGTVSGWEVKT